MRNVTQVLACMLTKIPASETVLRAHLNTLVEQVKYLAPELQGDAWRVTANNLNTYMPYPPEEDWHFEVGAIFADEDLDIFRAKLNN